MMGENNPGYGAKFSVRLPVAVSGARRVSARELQVSQGISLVYLVLLKQR